MAHTFDVDGWLGEFAETATSEQKHALKRLNDDLTNIYKDADLADDLMEAFNAGAAVILGDTSTQTLLDEVNHLEAKLWNARVRMRAGLLVELQTKSEMTIHSEYGIARNTIRKAAGK